MISSQDIFTISSQKQFEKIALKVFRYQYENNKVYREFCDFLNTDVQKVKSLEKIPFLPIQFFKSHDVVSNTEAIQETFTSSGTTGMITSKHLVTDVSLYEQSYRLAFSEFYGNIEDYAVLALLPSYLERSGSSLIYMVNDLIEGSNHPESGFYLNNYDELIATAEKMRAYINTRNVPGVDEIKIDVNKDKPSMKVIVDREKAGELGVSTSQVGQQLRSAIFGAKAGIYKEDGDDYDINVRFNEDIRYNKSAIFDQKITFRDMASGQIKTIPVSSIATQSNSSGFSAIKHRDTKRVVTVYSQLAPGYVDAAAVVNQIKEEMKSFSDLPPSIKIDYTGQLEEQNKQQAFLIGAFFKGLALIFFILIFQFNSVSKPAIIMIAIFLSFIGVFGGIVISGSSFVIMMTMMGIIALAGIVVNNGVVLLDYMQLLIDRKKEEFGLEDQKYLPKELLLEAIIKAGKARLRPVLLTAITTILGLIPLAIGLNINFFSLFSEFDANIYMGGDNVIFWGPLAWAVIYGLFVATFLTLIVVPILFYLITRFKMWLHQKFNGEIVEVLD